MIPVVPAPYHLSGLEQGVEITTGWAPEKRRGSAKLRAKPSGLSSLTTRPTCCVTRPRQAWLRTTNDRLLSRCPALQSTQVHAEAGGHLFFTHRGASTICRLAQRPAESALQCLTPIGPSLSTSVMLLRGQRAPATTRRGLLGLCKLLAALGSSPQGGCARQGKHNEHCSSTRRPARLAAITLVRRLLEISPVSRWLWWTTCGCRPKRDRQHPRLGQVLDAASGPRRHEDARGTGAQMARPPHHLEVHVIGCTARAERTFLGRGGGGDNEGVIEHRPSHVSLVWMLLGTN